MTMPSLIANHKNKVLAARAKKTYSLIGQAIQRYQADEGTVGDVTGLFNPEQTSAETLTKFAKYFDSPTICLSNTGTCKIKNNRIFYSIPLYSGSDNGASINYFTVPNMILKDSSFIAVRQYSPCERTETSIVFNSDGTKKLDADGNPVTNTYISNYCAAIVFDTNGTSTGPNQYGADVFELRVRADGKYIGWYYTGWNSLQAILRGKDPIYTKYTAGQQKP